jgi:hypothetical protein
MGSLPQNGLWRQALLIDETLLRKVDPVRSFSYFLGVTQEIPREKQCRLAVRLEAG